jgi:hypothetical protein
MASFIDDFNRPDGELGEGWEMLQRLYQPRLPATDGFIRDGKYTYNGTQVVYAVRDLGTPIHTIGTEGSWRRIQDGADTAVALVITGNDNLITDMLHLVVQRHQWGLTVRRNNGTFDPVLTGVFQPPLDLDKPYQFELSATDDTVTVKVPGQVKTAHLSTTGLLGNHVFWEEYLNPDQFPAGSVFDFDTVWATADGQPLIPVG